MTIKTATKCAVVGVSFGLFMFITRPLLVTWIGTAAGLKEKGVILIMAACDYVTMFVYNGCLLLFFITLLLKQRPKEKM